MIKYPATFAFKLSTQETNRSRQISVRSRPALSVELAPGQPGLHREPGLTKQTKNPRKRPTSLHVISVVGKIIRGYGENVNLYF